MQPLKESLSDGRLQGNVYNTNVRMIHNTARLRSPHNTLHSLNNYMQYQGYCLHISIEMLVGSKVASYLNSQHPNGAAINKMVQNQPIKA